MGSRESWKEKNKLETESRPAWLLALEGRAVEGCGELPSSCHHPALGQGLSPWLHVRVTWGAFKHTTAQLQPRLIKSGALGAAQPSAFV